MKRSTPIKYTANTSRYNIRSKSDKPSGRKDTGGFFFYTYLRSADFLPRLFALTKQLRTSLYLPVAASTSNRVRQMDRRNDTALLNRGCDHCLCSPHLTHSVSAHWGPHKTSTALCCTGCTYTPEHSPDGTGETASAEKGIH